MEKHPIRANKAKVENEPIYNRKENWLLQKYDVWVEIEFQKQKPYIRLKSNELSFCSIKQRQ